MGITTSTNLRFISKPSRKARTLAPMQWAIVVGWILTMMLFIAASHIMQHNMISGALMLIMGSAFGYHMAGVTVEVVKASHSSFDLSLDGNFITLSSRGTSKHDSTIKRLPLSDISLGEYYSMKDSCSLILYGAQTQLELPLWSFGPEAEASIISYLRARGIPITHLPER